MQSRARTVSSYLGEVEADRRSVLRKLRTLIRKAVPGVKESMRYGMPTYERGGQMFCAFARFRAELDSDDCGKSCIRFRRPGDIRMAVLGRLLRAAVKAQGRLRANDM